MDDDVILHTIDGHYASFRALSSVTEVEREVNPTPSRHVLVFEGEPTEFSLLVRVPDGLDVSE